MAGRSAAAAGERVAGVTGIAAACPARCRRRAVPHSFGPTRFSRGAVVRPAADRVAGHRERGGSAGRGAIDEGAGAAMRPGSTGRALVTGGTAIGGCARRCGTGGSARLARQLRARAPRGLQRRIGRARARRRRSGGAGGLLRAPAPRAHRRQSARLQRVGAGRIGSGLRATRGSRRASGRGERRMQAMRAAHRTRSADAIGRCQPRGAGTGPRRRRGAATVLLRSRAAPCPPCLVELRAAARDLFGGQALDVAVVELPVGARAPAQRRLHGRARRRRALEQCAAPARA